MGLHYTAVPTAETGQIVLTFQRRFCLNCKPIVGRVCSCAAVDSPSVGTACNSPSMGLGCPLHKIRYMRGSARPSESERICWLR